MGHSVTGDRTSQSIGRGVGREFAPVCIDDASRVAYTQTMPDEKKESAGAFLEAAIVYYERLETLHAQDQRQGRALHPNRATRVGLCRGL